MIISWIWPELYGFFLGAMFMKSENIIWAEKAFFSGLLVPGKACEVTHNTPHEHESE